MTIIEVITQHTPTIVEVNSFISVPIGGNNGQVLAKASNTTGDLEWIDVAGGGGSATNLSIANKTSTTFDVLSSTGTDVTLPAATITEAGLLIATDKVKLNSLATVATSGSYADLSGTPSIPAAQVNSDWNSVNGLSQILNKPSIFPSNIANVTGLQTALDGKFNNPTGDTTQYLAGDGSLVAFPIAGQAGTLVRQVRNESGGTLTKGTVVYISGASGNKALVTKAIATSDATSAQTFGVVQADIPTNQNGYVVVRGDLTGLDTNTFPDGTQLYLSGSVAGTLTSTKPVAPLHMVYIGVVTRQHATQGQLEVAIQNGYEMDELHDVLIVSKTNKDVISYDSVSGLWKNKQLTSGDVSDLDTQLSSKQPLATVLTNTTASFTSALETKLNGIATGAEVNVNADWNSVSGDSQILNKPSTFTPSAHSHVISDVTGLQTALDGKQPLDGDLTAIAALAGTSGFLKKTAVDTWTLDTSSYYLSSNPSGYTNNTGTVTNFLFTNGSGFTGSVSNSTSTPTLSLALQNATSGQSGQLTSTDWNTFNGKQAALDGTGFVKVTGTTVSYDNSTYLTGNQSITLSGDASGSGTTAITVTLGNNVVTNAKLAQVATATFKGRITASTGNVEDLTATQATSLLNLATTSLKGLIPATGTPSGKFLKDDLTWDTPAGGGGGGGLTLTEFEVDFGTKPTRSKKFTITAAGVTGSSKIIVSPSGNVAAGRVGDDWEWDSISTSAKAGTGQFVLTCFASGKVAGKRKFYYTYS